MKGPSSANKAGLSEDELAALVKNITELKEQRAAVRHRRQINALAITHAKRDNRSLTLPKQLKASDDSVVREALEAKTAFLNAHAERDSISATVPIPRATIEKRLRHLLKSLTKNIGVEGVKPVEVERAAFAEFFEFQALHRRVGSLESANEAMIVARERLQQALALLNKHNRNAHREEQAIQRRLDESFKAARALRREVARANPQARPAVSVAASESLMERFRAGQPISMEEMQDMLEHSSLFKDPNPTDLTDTTEE